MSMCSINSDHLENYYGNMHFKAMQNGQKQEDIKKRYNDKTKCELKPKEKTTKQVTKRKKVLAGSNVSVLQKQRQKGKVKKRRLWYIKKAVKEKWGREQMIGWVRKFIVVYKLEYINKIKYQGLHIISMHICVKSVIALCLCICVWASECLCLCLHLGFVIQASQKEKQRGGEASGAGEHCIFDQLHHTPMPVKTWIIN